MGQSFPEFLLEQDQKAEDDDESLVILSGVGGGSHNAIKYLSHKIQ